MNGSMTYPSLINLTQEWHLELTYEIILRGSADLNSTDIYVGLHYSAAYIRIGLDWIGLNLLDS